MRNEIEKFHHSVNVLVKAYLNNTLEHNNCYACALGNLIADANGYQYTQCVDTEIHKLALVQNNGMYNRLSCVGDYWYMQIEEPEMIMPEGIRELDSIGYSISEAARIEFAFERSDRGASGEEWMFNGLMAVVDVLSQIHGVDLSVKEEAKKLFVKA